MGVANLNYEKLSFFSNINYENENTIVQKSGNKATTSAGIWSKGNIFRWARPADQKEANNDIRTQLLESLGEAFGISEGIGTDENGKKTFSSAFMDRLENILGPAFKRADFFGSLSNSGVVNSGKPLTQRRISAILTQAKRVGNAPYSRAVYTTKVQAMIANTTPNTSMRKFADKLMGMMSFLEDKLPNLIKKNPNYNPEENEDEYIMNKDEYLMNIPESEVPKEGLYPKNFKTGEWVPFRKGPLESYITSHSVMHFENLGKGNSDDPVKIIKYAKSVLTNFIKLAVDLYEQLKDTDKKQKMEDSLSYIIEHPGCVEGMTTSLGDLQVECGIQNVGTEVVDYSEKTHLEECMYKEVGFLMRGRHESPKWSECRPILEEKLVGQLHPLEKGGKPKKITLEDIDALKETFMINLVGEE